MALVEALEDLKAELAAGKPVAEAVAQVAEEHDLRPVFLQNRAAAVLGELATYAERHAVAAEAERANMEGAKKKIALARIRERIENHNSGVKRVSGDELQVLCAAANALGADYQLVRRGQRRQVDPFDRAVAALVKEFMRMAGLK